MKIYKIEPLEVIDQNQPLFAKDLADGLSFCGLEKKEDDPLEVKISIVEMTEDEYESLGEHSGW